MEEKHHESELRRYNVDRSCLKCHERKIRCDRRNPCASCVRLNVSCRYPGPERAKRRQQKKVAVTTDLSTRLTQLENAIAALADGHSSREENSNSQGRNRITDTLSEKSPGKQSLTEIVRPSEVSTGTASRGLLLPDRLYINDRLLSRVLEKEHELQSAIGSPNVSSGYNSSNVKASSINLDTILFGCGHSAVDVSILHPSPREISQLWQVYRNNVDVHIKVLHIPTVQSMLFAAVNDLKNVPHDLNALLFAIYFSATSSLDPESVGHILGQERSATLQRFQQGIELSLSRASFLGLPTVTSLQAFVIFLTSMRVHNNGRATWTLASLATRLAQSIGLHRDGKNFNLSPLESEVRRRLWWQIVNNDHRAAEDHGIAVCVTYGFCDTELPLHINDTDISANSKTLPPPRQEFCDMTCFLIVSEASRVFRECLPPMQHVRCGGSNSNESERRKLLKELIARLEQVYLLLCDVNVPAQRSVYILGRVLISKMDFLNEQQSLTPEANEGAISSSGAERSLTLACRVLELCNTLLQDELLSHAHWVFLSYRQYHTLTYVLWKLCVSPTVPDADGIWDLVNLNIRLIESYKSIAGLGPKWPLIRRLREKALSIRERLVVVNRDLAATEETNFPSHSQEVPNARGVTTPEADFLNYVNWDIHPFSLSDWNNFSLIWISIATRCDIWNFFKHIYTMSCKRLLKIDGRFMLLTSRPGFK